MGDEAMAADLRRRGIRDERTLAAIAALNRADFVPEHRADATGDFPLGIGHGQTISQPYIVGVMTEALRLTGRDRVLEIGTGSGYQTAVLSLLCAEVFSVEVIPALHERAKAVLEDRFENVHLALGDGYAGWPERAPFDRILLTAAPPTIPNTLVDQLARGGILIGPVGAQELGQDLVRIQKREDGTLSMERLLPVRFVPMTHGDARVSGLNRNA